MNYWTKKNEMKRKAVEHTKEMMETHKDEIRHSIEATRTYGPEIDLIERLQKAVQMYEYVELTEEEKSEYLPSDIALREIDEDGYIPLMYTVDETKLCRELQISYNVPEQQLHYFVCRSLVKAERWSIDEMIAYLEDEPDKIWEDLYDKAIDAEIRTGINVDEDSINDTAECQKEDEAILEKAEQAALQERKLLLGKNIVQKQSFMKKK